MLPVAGAGSGCRLGLNSDLRPESTEPDGPWAAGRGGTPSFGSGAGVGNGTVSATAADVALITPSSNAPIQARWPLIIPSPRSPFRGLPSPPMWRHDG